MLLTPGLGLQELDELAQRWIKPVCRRKEEQRETDREAERFLPVSFQRAGDLRLNSWSKVAQE